MSLVYDLFPPVLLSIAQADMGHLEAANVKSERCIPLGFSLTIVLLLLAALSGKVVSRGLFFLVLVWWGFFTFGFLFGWFYVWHLRVTTKKINTYSFSL